MTDLCSYWRKFPPAHWLLRGLAGYKPTTDEDGASDISDAKVQADIQADIQDFMKQVQSGQLQQVATLRKATTG